MNKQYFDMKEKFLLPRLQIIISVFGYRSPCFVCWMQFRAEPLFIANTTDCKRYSESDFKKYQRLSEESAKLGWNYLNRYFNKENLIPAFNKSYVGDAMRNFNYCWSLNNQNYQAYWGAGVVRGVQAT